jgi:hypothetical protein
MESTKQITKAMEMVAASKLRRAQAQVLSSRPYFEILYSTIQDILSQNQDTESAYLKARPVKKSLFVVIAGDRGLAGGYNSNILKMVVAQMEGKDALVLPIGKKAMDYFRSHKVPMLNETYGNAEDISVGDCFSVAKLLCKAFGDHFARGIFSFRHRRRLHGHIRTNGLSQHPRGIFRVDVHLRHMHLTFCPDIFIYPDTTHLARIPSDTLPRFQRQVCTHQKTTHFSLFPPCQHNTFCSKISFGQ